MDHATPPPPGDLLPGRRTFFGWLTYTLSAAAALVVGLPFIGYVLGARKGPEEWFTLGPLSEFPQGQTRVKTFTNPIRQPWDGEVARVEVFVRYEGVDDHAPDPGKRHRFLVLAVNCAHLGCPVQWFQESGLFMCPCHGGVYYANGERASGPPPRGLYPYLYRVVREDGVDKLQLQAPHYPTLQDTLQDPA